MPCLRITTAMIIRLKVVITVSTDCLFTCKAAYECFICNDVNQIQLEAMTEL
jgi:hypothetical protein